MFYTVPMNEPLAWQNIDGQYFKTLLYNRLSSKSF